MLTILALIATGALFVIVLTLIGNVLFFPRLQPNDKLEDQPLISVMIPARNEAEVIGTTLQKLRAQTYPNFEVLLLDDDSSDGTREVASIASEGDIRITIHSGKPLPPRWSGKSWACQQLAQQARGDILLFTDADVRWEPEALAAVVALMQRGHADMLTVWPTQETATFAERFTVPAMTFVILGYLPILGVHHIPLSSFAAANGQCMAWKRKTYWQTGGHEAVADNVLDDVTLARLAKARGGRIRMADGNNLIHTRMYRDWQTARDGFAKNILAGYGNSVPALVMGGVFHWLVFLFPWLLLLLPDFRLWGALLIVLGIGARALSAAFAHQRLFDAVFMPVSVLLFTRIAAQSIYWHYTGGPRWKGRKIAKQSEDNSTWNEPTSSSSAQASGD